MRQLKFLFLVGMCASLPGDCSLSPPASASTIGDSCLVGGWTLDHEVNLSGWSYSNTPVSVSGLHGARLTLGADGTETVAFAESNPLSGLGRSVEDFGADWVVLSRGGLSDLTAEIAAWREAGGTHVSVDTMGRGLDSVDVHIDYLASLSDALSLS